MNSFGQYSVDINDSDFNETINKVKNEYNLLRNGALKVKNSINDIYVSKKLNDFLDQIIK